MEGLVTEVILKVVGIRGEMGPLLQTTNDAGSWRQSHHQKDVMESQFLAGWKVSVLMLHSMANHS